MPTIISTLNASVTGDGDHTVVLANGLGTNQQTWRHVVDALKGTYRIVRFDYVGTPDADLAAYEPHRYASLHGHADDVVALLDALDLSNITFVGHSVSGMIGALASLAAPDRFAGMVFISASPRYIDDGDYVGGMSRGTVDDILAAAASDYHAWVGGFSPLAVGPAHAPELIDEFASYLRRMRPDVASQTLHTVFTSDFRHILPRVHTPVVVVQSQSDVAVPAVVARYLAGHLPNATLHELKATGHVPQLTDPAEVVTVLEKTLEKILAQRVAA